MGTMATDMTTRSALHNAMAMATMATTLALSEVRNANNPASSSSSTSERSAPAATSHRVLFDKLRGRDKTFLSTANPSRWSWIAATGCTIRNVRDCAGTRWSFVIFEFNTSPRVRGPVMQDDAIATFIFAIRHNDTRSPTAEPSTEILTRVLCSTRLQLNIQT